MRRIILLTVLVVCGALLAPGAETPEFSISYAYQGSQPVPANSWFGMNGARGDVVWNFARHWALVGEVGGSHTNIYGPTSSPLTMITGMIGPRFYLIPRGRKEKPMRLRPFLQVLGGAAYATEGKFPQALVVKNQAHSVAGSAGGGLEMRARKNVSIRLIQADILYTQLPNGYDNYQMSYRFGAGIVFDF